MGRNYVKKIGPHGYFKYTPENKRKAVEEVNTGRNSIRGVAEKYGIPYATLNDAIKGKHPLKHGRPTALNDVEERQLVEVLMTCANWGFPLTHVDTKKLLNVILTI